MQVFISITVFTKIFLNNIPLSYLVEYIFLRLIKKL